MTAANRLKYANRIVGIFTLLICVLLIAVLATVARRKGFGAATFQLAGLIEAENIDGIQKGTDVLFLGQRVGEVLRLEYYHPEE